MLPVLFGVVTLTFFLMHLTDGDPATIIALDRYGSQLISPEMIDELARQEGLDRSIYIQYAAWLKMIATGHFGNSLRSGVPVIDEIRDRFPRTLILAVSAVIITAFIAIPCGILAAYRRDGVFDRLTRGIAAVKVSIPGFYMALLLILLFSVKLGWLPSFGTATITMDNASEGLNNRNGENLFWGVTFLIENLRHMILPVSVLVLSQVGFTLRMVRSSILDILETEYVQYAMLRGLSRSRILFVHVLKNAMVPVMTWLSLQFLMVLEGSIIVETVFAWPGIGKLFQEALMGRDFTMIQALVLFSGILISLTNFATDLACHWVDRRMNVMDG